MKDKETQDRWDKVYQNSNSVPAMAVVRENLHLLPKEGIGLELACGLAANSFMLAEQGIKMDAWDISPVAAERVNKMAQELNLPVTAVDRDVIIQPPEASRYDVIVVSHFLDRTIVPAIINCLKPGGLVFYQTFCRTRVSAGGPSNEDFRLADGELLSLFAGLKVVAYRENGLLGDVTQGLRNEAMLVAQKQ
jgi:tellurite methyltransferase